MKTSPTSSAAYRGETQLHARGEAPCHSLSHSHRACEDLSILKDTPGAVDEWRMLFNDYKIRIRTCKQDKGPWFRGDPPPVLRPYTPAPTTALAVPPPTQSQQFQINPVTHSGFTATDRSRAIKAAAADRCRTTVGGIIAVQLLHGTAGLPATHMSPFLLAEVWC